MAVPMRLRGDRTAAWRALQECRGFVSGSVWGINSFDQWGVEPRLQSGGGTGLDGSTAGPPQKLRAK